MPLFEYFCDDCQAELELLVRSGETPVCDSCGSQRLTKLLSVPAGHTAGREGATPGDQPPGPCGSACGCFPQ